MIGAKLDEESAKRQKLKDVTEEEATAEYEKEKEELRLSLKIIHNDDSEVNYESLSIKFPIMSWEYQLLEKMEAKDMEERFQDHPLEGHDLFLWGDLKIIFDSNKNDELWMNQLDWKLVRWKLHENYRVHTFFMDGELIEINMLVEKYPLIKKLLEKMLILQLEAEEESTMAFKLIKLIKSLLEEIMRITKEQQQALDDALIPQEKRLRIGNCNYRLSTTFKPKESTFQISLDVLSLTPFYQAFLISVSVSAIYMHEFRATVSFHKQCIKFKLNKKNHSFDLETFKDLLQIFPNIPGQKFLHPSFEEELLAFIRTLSYSGNIKSLSDVKVETLPQPWRTFRTIVNKCLSDMVYQIENKVSKKNKDMYYPRFTKVLVDHFMSKDKLIPRRNKVEWYMAKDDLILATMRFIPKHETIQKYSAILPDTLTNQAMKESDAYKTYYDFATRKVIPKSKYVRRSTREKTDQAPKASPGTNEGTGVSPGVPDVPTYGSEDEQISWKSSDKDDDDEVSMRKDDDEDNVDNEDDDDQDDDNADNENDDDQDDDNEQTKSDNDDDVFVHPKLSTFDEEERHEEKLDEEEEGSDQRIHTPSHYESTDDEAYDEVTQGDNVEEEKSSSVSSGFISKMLNPNPDTDDFSELKQTNLFVEVVSSIPGIINKYLANQMNEVVKAVVQLELDRIRDEAKAENKDFINKIDENIKKIIKEQVKVQVKEQVSKIFPRNEKTINEQLKAEVLIRSSNEAKTSHAKTLYKAFIGAYESEKDILTTYGDIVTLKRRRDDKDEDDEPSAGSNRGSKRRKASKEPESTSAQNDKTSKSTG
nr:hypothetical protein [Tanacetum cinerariifolium]